MTLFFATASENTPVGEDTLTPRMKADVGRLLLLCGLFLFLWGQCPSAVLKPNVGRIWDDFKFSLAKGRFSLLLGGASIAPGWSPDAVKTGQKPEPTLQLWRKL